MGGFTHKGKALDLGQEDDFKDQIVHSSDEDQDPENKRGVLTGEMVERLNFGGGEG